MIEIKKREWDYYYYVKSYVIILIYILFKNDVK